jgi:starch synthase
MRVLSIASEIYPLIKTGGLADVAGALPAALAGQGIQVTTLIPGYPAVLAALQSPETVTEAPGIRVLAGTAHGLTIWAIDAPHLYARPGGPYTQPDGADWPDNAQRFATLARVAASLAPRFDLLHAHDWQAGLLPAYLAYAGTPHPPSVFTVHNLAYQGQYPASLLAELGLPPHAYSIEGVEYFGSIGFLKSGLYFADRITTVSPTYAQEILTPDAGMGLDGLLRRRADRLVGIRNGIDTTIWDPATDPNLPSHYNASRLTARRANKSALQTAAGLDVDDDALLYAVVSRLTWQKGLDMLLAALPALLAPNGQRGGQRGAQLFVLGTGDPPLQQGFAQAAQTNPGRIGAIIGYDETIAHLVQGGADALVVPSRFEPCGLTQLCALRYGCLPIVARVGGLADTIIDANDAALAAGTGTGLQFVPPTTSALEAALRRAAALWRDKPTWRRLQSNAMHTDVSWDRPAAQYAALYRGLSAAA